MLTFPCQGKYINIYSYKLWDTQKASVTFNYEKKNKKKILQRIPEYRDTKKPMLFPSWQNIPSLCKILAAKKKKLQTTRLGFKFKVQNF